MKYRWPIAALVTLFLMPFFTVQACGPDFYPDVFAYRLRPDKPKEFAEGKLGLLLPTFPRADLIVAFRYLNGGNLNATERAAYQPTYSYAELASNDDSAPIDRKESGSPLEKWKALRAKYISSPASIEQDRRLKMTNSSGFTYETSYLNCHDDAFVTAASTFKSRARTWGEKSPDLLEWLRGQDAVFANCAGGESVLPHSAPGSSSELLKADRAYQVAAAEFYAAKFDDARKAFEDITKESSSPWHGIAGYLAARCLVRQAFLLKQESGDLTAASFDPDKMRQAADALRQLLKGKTHGIPRKDIQAELNLVRLRIEPLARAHELATALAGPKNDTDYDQHLQDLTWFLNMHCDQMPLREDVDENSFLTPEQMRSGKRPTPALKNTKFNLTYRQLASTRSSETLVDWLLTFQSPSEEAKLHAIARWKATHKPHWLLAAIAKTRGNDADALSLVEAAEQMGPDSPAWESLTYHRVRLLTALRKVDNARTLLNQIMPQIQATGRDSSINAFTGLRMHAALTLSEFLQYAPRRVLVRSSEEQAAVDECLDVMKNPRRKYDCKKLINPTEFSSDAARFFNTEAPLNILVEAANSSVLPEQLRRSVAMMAWVRSLLLKEDATAAKLFLLLPAKLQREAGSGTGFRALAAVVRNPGLRPYLDPGIQRSYSYDFVESYRDNWWGKNWQNASLWDGYTWLDKDPVSFLSPTQQTEGERQVASPDLQENAKINLGRRVLDYAKDHPDDTDVPETLFLVLRMIRYGSDSSPFAWDSPERKDEMRKVDMVRKDAARLLRQRYVASPWTKKAAPFVD